MTAASIKRSELIARLSDPSDPFDITPRPSPNDVGSGTVNLRLGSIFLGARLLSESVIDAERLGQGQRLFDEFRIRPQAQFIIQSRQLVLTSTLEYLSLPHDLTALIQSRSSFGRMGLIAATAAHIGPGYKGCPTLELVNAGEIALRIKPYLDVCQLVVYSAAEDPDLRPSRYQCLTRPVPARQPLPPS